MLFLLVLGASGTLSACTTLGRFERSVERPPAHDDTAIYRSAQLERAEYLAREVARLRADLRQAEEAMVAIESGLRSAHTRADAVSSLAEARISVERASQSVPWRKDAAAEARSKLEEAERQFQAGHTGSAVFFASRAQRIAETLNEEARKVSRFTGTRFVSARKANLRAGPSTREPVVEILVETTPVLPERQQQDWVLVRTPSGVVGWIHGALLAER
jgi:hypothetical protein